MPSASVASRAPAQPRFVRPDEPGEGPEQEQDESWDPHRQNPPRRQGGEGRHQEEDEPDSAGPRRTPPPRVLAETAEHARSTVFDL